MRHNSDGTELTAAGRKVERLRTGRNISAWGAAAEAVLLAPSFFAPSFFAGGHAVTVLLAALTALFALLAVAKTAALGHARALAGDAGASARGLVARIW